jgi:hypothetical protein
LVLIYVDPINTPGFYINREGLLNRVYFFDHLDAVITTDFNEYINTECAFKIASLYNRFYGNEIDNNFIKENFDQIKSKSNLVFIIQTELCGDDIVDYCQDNVYGVLAGFFDKASENQNIIFRGVWFETIADLYKKLPAVLGKIEYNTKPLYFDALLGRKKIHRDFVYNSVNNYQLNDKILLNYYQDNKNIFDNFLTEPGLSSSNNEWAHSSMSVNYLNLRVPASNVLPVTIYNQTAYSIVAETECVNQFTFYTEKTVKPILARRLFVMFAGRHYLKNLRKLGFQTFSNVIDESYDEITDNCERWTWAFQQVMYLCEQDQSRILTMIKPIVDHNYHVLMSTDWTNAFIDQINKIYKTIDVK